MLNWNLAFRKQGINHTAISRKRRQYFWRKVRSNEVCDDAVFAWRPCHICCPFSGKVRKQGPRRRMPHSIAPFLSSFQVNSTVHLRYYVRVIFWALRRMFRFVKSEFRFDIRLGVHWKCHSHSNSNVYFRTFSSLIIFLEGAFCIKWLKYIWKHHCSISVMWSPRQLLLMQTVPVHGLQDFRSLVVAAAW